MARWIAAVLVVLVAVLGFIAWRNSTPPPASPRASAAAPANGATTSPPSDVPAEPPAAPAPAVATPPAGGPGVVWNVPSPWSVSPPRPMRLATYEIGDAECAVFYFGPNQGGAVDENIARWSGQFAGAPQAKREERTVRGMKVTRVEIRGAYLAPGADMQSQGTRPDWELLGAIVQGSQGPLFFKLTGPAATVGAATKDFDALLASLAKR